MDELKESTTAAVLSTLLNVNPDLTYPQFQAQGGKSGLIDESTVSREEFLHRMIRPDQVLKEIDAFCADLASALSLRTYRSFIWRARKNRPSL